MVGGAHLSGTCKGGAYEACGRVGPVEYPFLQYTPSPVRSQRQAPRSRTTSRPSRQTAPMQAPSVRHPRHLLQTPLQTCDATAVRPYGGVHESPCPGGGAACLRGFPAMRPPDPRPTLWCRRVRQPCITEVHPAAAPAPTPKFWGCTVRQVKAGNGPCNDGKGVLGLICEVGPRCEMVTEHLLNAVLRTGTAISVQCWGSVTLTKDIRLSGRGIMEWDGVSAWSTTGLMNPTLNQGIQESTATNEKWSPPKV